MTNNDILRRLRYLFSLNDLKIIELFQLTHYDLKKTDVTDWFKPEEEKSYLMMRDVDLSILLNGIIIDRRGKREGPVPEPEDPLSNNMILRKLKIALDFKSDDILELFESIDKKISPHELSAFFRNPNHKSYRFCNDQYLRHFLKALQTKYSNTLGKLPVPRKDQ